MYDFDSTLIFVDLKAGRALLADDPQLETGLEVRVSDLFDAPAIGGADRGDRRTRLRGEGLDPENAPLFSALNWRNLPTSWS